MDGKLIEAMTYRANQGGYMALRSDESVTDICGECPWTECNKKMDFSWCVFELLQRAADSLKAKDAQLAEKDKQLAAAVALVDQVNNVAVEAIEYGPYQDGDEAAIFGRIRRMTRRGPQEAGEGGG